ncbi:hypothetical protein DW089_04285 [Acidaminococcus sp. AM05-11]|nr:hypothetical protein DW089_04285 [Acidaminococcus sp. AM05-11]
MSFGEKRKQLFAGREKRGWYPEIEIILLQFCRYFCYRNPHDQERECQNPAKNEASRRKFNICEKVGNKKNLLQGISNLLQQGKTRATM